MDHLILIAEHVIVAILFNQLQMVGNVLWDAVMRVGIME